LPTHAFEDLLLEAIDEGLSSLGASGKQAIYAFLQGSFQIDKPDIPYRLEEFVDAIEKLFGLGAKFLEVLIMKRIHEKLGQVFKYDKEPQDLIFTEYVEAARQSFLRKPNYELVKCE
jgi:hypothetical protein